MLNPEVSLETFGHVKQKKKKKKKKPTKKID